MKTFRPLTFLLALALTCGTAWAAGKISEMTPLGGAPASNDLIEISKTSGGPLTRSITVANLFTSPTLTTPNIGVATGTTLSLTKDDAGTTTVIYPVAATHTSSGTAAAGFGVGVNFIGENGSGTNRSIGDVEAVYANVTNTSEDSDIVIKGMRNGTPDVEFARFRSTNGNFTAGDLCLADPSTIGTATCIRVGSSQGVRFMNAAASADVNVLSANFGVGSGGQYLFSQSSGDPTATKDTGLARDAAGVVQFNGGTAGTTKGGYKVIADTKGGYSTKTSLNETTTLNTGSTTTATTIAVPANSEVQAILIRVTTTITTAANFTVKLTGGTNPLCQIGTATTSNVTLTAGTTYVLKPCAGMALADYQTAGSTSTITYTLNANPGAGAIEATPVYTTFSPPTS